MRLTDADALKQTFCAECDHSIKCEDCDIDYHFEHLAPTVDAVEAVRCKDCKWRNVLRCYHKRSSMNDLVGDNDFCSWGERREDVQKSD